MFEQLKMFLNEAYQELRKVTWPSRKEVTASTGVVLVVVVFFVAVVAVVDWGLHKALQLLY